MIHLAITFEKYSEVNIYSHSKYSQLSFLFYGNSVMQSSGETSNENWKKRWDSKFNQPSAIFSLKTSSDKIASFQKINREISTPTNERWTRHTSISPKEQADVWETKPVELENVL